jgi:anthranilate/para-aminobenzoate synthase component II
MRDALPECLEISAWTSNGIIMGLRHRQFPVEGVQFHPESIMTEVGKDLLRNFLNQKGTND